jgi:hypothetical protein
VQQATTILIALGLGCSSDKAITVHNSAPGATVLAPVAGAQFESDDTITFEGIADDLETDPSELLVTWATDIDGVLTEDSVADAVGRVVYSTSALSPGEQTLSIRVVDGGGRSATDSVTFFVVDSNDPPTISVRHPSPDGSDVGEEGVGFEFEAIVGDAQDDALDLIVTVNRIGDDGEIAERLCVALPESDGVAICEASLIPGLFTLSFEVEDTDANVTEAIVTYKVRSGLDIDNDGDGMTENEGDCDDTDEDTFPGAFELINGIDDDCNGLVDDGTTAYDDDGDGFSEDAMDCDDTDPSIYPYAAEVCDGVDNDCNGTIDGSDAIDADTWYADLDGDGFGDWASSTAACEDPDGYISDATDCNDTDPSAFPGATESCDGADNNCDGFIDEEGALGCSWYYQDVDLDGFGSTISMCTCAPTGDFTSILSSDCYDDSALVSPTHTSFHTSQRGDGSYDYNCDDTEERQWTDISDTCGFFSDFGCSAANGWSGGPPSCGASGTWRTDCHYEFDFFGSGCYFETETSRTQACR